MATNNKLVDYLANMQTGNTSTAASQATLQDSIDRYINAVNSGDLNEEYTGARRIMGSAYGNGGISGVDLSRLAAAMDAVESRKLRYEDTPNYQRDLALQDTGGGAGWGPVIGTLVGLALAPATGGASLALAGAIGGGLGAAATTNSPSEAGKGAVQGGLSGAVAGYSPQLFGTEGIAGNLGSSFANTAANSAAKGGLNSALSGGNPLTGALSGGITGGAGNLASGFDTGFGQTGNDIFTGAATGAVGGAFSGNALAGAFSGAAGGGANSLFNNGFNFGGTSNSTSDTSNQSGANMFDDNYSYFGGLPDSGSFDIFNSGSYGGGIEPSPFGTTYEGNYDFGDGLSSLPGGFNLSDLYENGAYSDIGNAYVDANGNYTGPTTGGLAGSATQSLLQRLLGGGGSGLGGLGSLIGSGLGAFGANQQANSLNSLAQQYAGYGAPSRARYESSFAPGFTMSNDPGFTDALNQSSKATLHGLSAQGNPADSPNAWSQSLADNFQKTAYPALQNYRNTNANAGGIASLQTALPNLQSQAIQSQGNIFNAIGSGVSNIFNPPQTLAEQLAALKNSGLY